MRRLTIATSLCALAFLGWMAIGFSGAVAQSPCIATPDGPAPVSCPGFPGGIPAGTTTEPTTTTTTTQGAASDPPPAQPTPATPTASGQPEEEQQQSEKPKPRQQSRHKGYKLGPNTWGFTKTGPYKAYYRNQEGGQYCGTSDTMAASGCGPAAVANGAATLLHRPDINPFRVANMFCQFHPPGSGFYATVVRAIGQHYGLKVTLLGNGQEAFRKLAVGIRSGGYGIGLTGKKTIAVNRHYFGVPAVKFLNGGGFRFRVNNSNPDFDKTEGKWFRPSEMLASGPRLPKGRDTTHDRIWLLERAT